VLAKNKERYEEYLYYTTDNNMDDLLSLIRKQKEKIDFHNDL
jgi:hypothetical protein